MSDTISIFDTHHGRGFEVPCIFSKGKHRTASASQRLAYLIDSSWYYSMHWPRGNHNLFLDKVQDDLNSELKKANKRLAELKEAQSILSKIERETESA